LGHFNIPTRLEAKPQSHTDSAAAAVILLEIEERSPGVIQRDAVRNAEVWVVERVEHLEPIPQLESLCDAEILEGDDRPIETVNETWYSPELGLIILSKRNDPRFGESTYRGANITRADLKPLSFNATRLHYQRNWKMIWRPLSATWSNFQE
jgi:hypothetical protein